MENHFNFSDAEFENKVNSCQLEASLFTHEAHLRLAWIHIRKYGIRQAEKNIQKQLLIYVQSVGAVDKFNLTLTIASIKVVYHFILKSKAENFNDFVSEFPQLKTGFKSLLDCHYRIDIYNCDRAKAIFLEPDLARFD